MNRPPLHIESQIAELAKIQQHLKVNKNKTGVFDYMDYCLDIREMILDYYELPKIESFTKLLKFNKIPNDEELAKVVAELSTASRAYKIDSKSYETEEVEYFIKGFKDANEVFDFLQVTPHDYMMFIYTEILYERKDSTESAIKAMRTADDPHLLDLLDRLRFQDEDDETENIIRFLASKGIKYLNEYVAQSKRENGSTKNSLVEFWDIISKQPHYSEYENWFKSFINILMNDLCLVANKQTYRIIETEIYFFDRESHHDPYTHQADEQLELGQWYFNGYGLDITFGNPYHKTNGGILIRGLKKLGTTPKYISGPSNVLKEIMTSMGTVIQTGHGLFLQRMFSKTEVKMMPTQSARIGLTKKEEDVRGFIDKPYRYIVELNQDHKFKNKTRVVSEMLASGIIKPDEVKSILGFNLESGK
jgi:3-methyladenine DNA glycosylase Mpg